MREQNITVEEAVDWVLVNRRGKTFVKQTAQQIEWAIHRAINCGGFTFSADDHGRLVGLICATPNKLDKVLRVHELLTTDKRALPNMVKTFQQRFAGYAITAKRHGREVAYRTARLVQLLGKQ